MVADFFNEHNEAKKDSHDKALYVFVPSSITFGHAIPRWLFVNKDETLVSYVLKRRRKSCTVILVSPDGLK